MTETDHALHREDTQPPDQHDRPTPCGEPPAVDERRRPTARIPGRDARTFVPLIVEKRGNDVLVVCGAYGGKGRTLAEAMLELKRRMPG
ncbi:MAG TPA: hypothetical protein VEL05_12745 [Candidatus Acidoferrum sp.]|nr:hypothetical protein [Candidatus Acidoferrum sp.]